MTLRVVQWATGNQGVEAIRAVLDRADLELVGAMAYSPDKVGVDAAALAGRDPIGVAATMDVDEVLALGADCVAYFPRNTSLDEVCAILASGANVVTTAFLFHPATNSLVIQRNRLGVSSSRLMAYLERLTDTEGLLAVMILNADVASALNRLQIVRKMHVRLASVKNPRLLTSHNPSTTEAIEILNAKAPVVDITVAMGRQRGSLSLQAIRSAAKRFLSWSGATDAPGDVEALKIDGKYDDESPAELDLLEYRMVERADVEPDPQSRRLLYEDRIRALKEAFERRKGELENMFAEEE